MFKPFYLSVFVICLGIGFLGSGLFQPTPNISLEAELKGDLSEAQKPCWDKSQYFVKGEAGAVIEDSSWKRNKLERAK